ncbi:MAG: sigma-70 family RNA polymerase sigma factor [Streptomycetaceae bacterium]|nr:sigma-70 family RNA polymerase sigma factor [Streptomycetaceae bacterium]
MVGVVPHSRDDEVDHRGLVLGDERTLGEVYDAYAEFVYGVALRVTGDEAVAEDITCGVFVALWERPYAYDPEQWSMGAWLVAGAHRRAVAVVGATPPGPAHPAAAHPEAAHLATAHPGAAHPTTANPTSANRTTPHPDPTISRTTLSDTALGAESQKTPASPAADAIAAALAGIAPELREVVELSYFQGLTYRQVAAKLSVAEAVVAERVRAGLRAWSQDRETAHHKGTEADS